MVGRTNAGKSGGIGDTYAAIIVGFPAGSKLTASTDERRIEVSDTSGECLLLVPEPGSWEITASDGTETASTIVDIEEDCQIENVYLSYALNLYAYGSTCDAATGGWGIRTGYDGDVTFGEDSINMEHDPDADDTSECVVYTKARIDFSGYSKLYFDITAVSSPRGSEMFYGVMRSTSGYTTLSNWTQYKQKERPSSGVYSVDVSGLSRNYVVLYADGCSININRIWMEK